MGIVIGKSMKKRKSPHGIDVRTRRRREIRGRCRFRDESRNIMYNRIIVCKLSVTCQRWVSAEWKIRTVR